MAAWDDVALALSGSWPGQVATWGTKGVAAYLAELQARELTPDAALTAIRSCEDEFPPPAGKLAKLARHDPSRPTFEELYTQLYGPGGLFGVSRSGVQISEWTKEFADSYGRERLRLLEVEHEDYGVLRRKELEARYDAFLEATDGREVHEIAERSTAGTLRNPFHNELEEGEDEGEW